MNKISFASVIILYVCFFAGTGSAVEADLDKAGETKESNNYKSRINLIVGELAKVSGTKYPVIIRDNIGWAEAKGNGMIVIDLTIARTQPKEIVAFLIAHEWGHLVYGSAGPKVPTTKVNKNTLHGGQGVRVNPQAIESAMVSRREEREADRYAVKFMVHIWYDVEPFVKFLVEAPDDQRLHYGLHTHDTREVRAKFIREEYQAQKQSLQKNQLKHTEKK